MDAHRQRQSPLRRARLARGWTQAATMRRFESVVRRLGGTCPDGASLRRMFAYWEAGAREVTEPLYRRAFVELFDTAPTILGFTSPSAPRIEKLASGLRLFTIDREMVALVEAQTETLRLTDRRVGTAVLLPQAEALVDQITRLLHSSIGGDREHLAAALAEAAALTGWLALDDGDLPRAWQLHETAKSAARESEDPFVLSHVTAQQATVLLDANQHDKAVDLVTAARSTAGCSAPPVLYAWLDATLAECLAAKGNATAAGHAMDSAERFAGQSDSAQLPYLLMTRAHLARWRGHCLARVGDPAAIDLLRSLEPAISEPVRAAIGLKTDLALALHRARHTDHALAVARAARDLADLHGSRRQRRRLAPLLGSFEGEEMKDADERA